MNQKLNNVSQYVNSVLSLEGEQKEKQLEDSQANGEMKDDTVLPPSVGEAA